MLVKTRFFGEVDIEDEKILTFDNGIMGFEDMKRWTLIYDIEKGSEGPISWFQSLDMAELALPVINPYTVTAVYEPVVEDELLKPLGEFKDEELVTFLTITIPSEDPSKTTANFRAPILINPVNRKGIQVIVNNEDYPIKFSIYESVQKMKAEKNK
ncbi:flagellar assembly protein FliW [Catonella massiliensis]|uniref:Flagellar assembly factor FliW n=1 Tax=Catonella massiliensis TaxID=2799636 RepID=A0ABS1IWX8_9FIRM|nr:flagellar assembly protein FliW [Catonella massiliensis]MBF1013894.1 flagellar assembly protein FliW [Lachnospiraceae bacterium]MBK5896403.1 flagellar assembly protein FliW [Catonella massiliensis]